MKAECVGNSTWVSYRRVSIFSPQGHRGRGVSQENTDKAEVEDTSEQKSLHENVTGLSFLNV